MMYTKAFTVGDFDNSIVSEFSTYKSIIIRTRPDICPICKCQEIDVISFRGIPQHYSDAVNAYFSGHRVSFDKYDINFMMCLACGHKFHIVWENDFPFPSLDDFNRIKFLKNFIDNA